MLFGEKSKMKTTTFHELNYDEFDNLVNGFFNTPGFYDYVASEECNNDESHTYTNITKKSYTEDKESDPLKVLDRNINSYIGLREAFEKKVFPMYCAYSILLELVGNDILPEGNYIINVSW